MAEVTGVRTEYTVAVDIGAVEATDTDMSVLPSMLALVASLAEEGYADVLWRELLAFRDDRNEVAAAHRDMGPGDVSVTRYGLSSYRQRGSQAVPR